MINTCQTEKAKRDYVLLRKALDHNDQQAYAELMRLYRDSIYYMLMRMVKNKDDAEDLVHHVVLAFHQEFGAVLDDVGDHDQDEGIGDGFPVVEGIAVQLGGQDGITFLFQAFQLFGQGGREGETQTEDAAHGGTEHLRGKEIGAVRAEENAVKAGGISGADDGAHIAGILNAIQGEEARTGSLASLEREDSSDTLGSLCVTNGLEDMGRERINRN